MKKSLTIPSIAIVFVLTGCGGSDSIDTSESSNPSTAVAQAIIAPGSVCTNGGVQISVGIDENANGVLDNNEVDAVEVICNGIDGLVGVTGSSGTDGLTSLIRMADEVAGANCLEGGIKVEAGLDDNGNGILEDVEVDAVNYVCNANVPTQDIVASYSIDHDKCLIADTSEATADYMLGSTPMKNLLWNCASFDNYFNVRVEMVFSDTGNSCFEVGSQNIWDLTQDVQVSAGNCNEPATVPVNPLFMVNNTSVSARINISDYGTETIVFDEVIENNGGVSAIGMYSSFQPTVIINNVQPPTGGYQIDMIKAGETYDTSVSTRGDFGMGGSMAILAGETITYLYTLHDMLGNKLTEKTFTYTFPPAGVPDLLVNSFNPSVYINVAGGLCVNIGQIGVTNLNDAFAYGVNLEITTSSLPYPPRREIALYANEDRSFDFGEMQCDYNHAHNVGDQISFEAKIWKWDPISNIDIDSATVIVTIQ